METQRTQTMGATEFDTDWDIGLKYNQLHFPGCNDFISNVTILSGDKTQL